MDYKEVQSKFKKANLRYMMTAMDSHFCKKKQHGDTHPGVLVGYWFWLSPTFSLLPREVSAKYISPELTKKKKKNLKKKKKICTNRTNNQTANKQPRDVR